MLGDVCHQEGISSASCSLAGHLKLGTFISLYDDNHISIDGRTDVSFTEDVLKRYEAYGWHVQHVADGNTDVDALSQAIAAAQAVTDKPSIITVTPPTGHGSPNKADTPAPHRAALRAHEAAPTPTHLDRSSAPSETPPHAPAQLPPPHAPCATHAPAPRSRAGTSAGMMAPVIESSRPPTAMLAPGRAVSGATPGAMLISATRKEDPSREK